jgi:hypothetical protein
VKTDSSAEAIFDTPPGKVIETPTEPIPRPVSDPYKPGREDYALAGLAVGAVEFIADRISPTPRLTEAQKREGTEVWAKAIKANFPDVKAGPIILALSALVWSVGTVASRAKGRPKREPGSSADGDRSTATDHSDGTVGEERTRSDQDREEAAE